MYYELTRELRARVFLGLGPTGPRPGVFSANIQHPVCTWTYKDHGLTTYNWLSREKNRYTMISWCLFLSINTPKMKSCRLKCYTLILAPLYLDFKLKSNRIWTYPQLPTAWNHDSCYGIYFFGVTRHPELTLWIILQDGLYATIYNSVIKTVLI